MKKLLSLGLALVLSLSLAVPASAARTCVPRPTSGALLGSTACTLTNVLRYACRSGSGDWNTQIQTILKQLLCNGNKPQPAPPAQTPDTPVPEQPVPEQLAPEQPAPEEPETPDVPATPDTPDEPDTPPAVEPPQDPEKPAEPSAPSVQPTLANGAAITTENVQAILYGLKADYPEGMPWTNDNSYYCAAVNTLGYGCAGFAFLCSDTVFGSLPVTGIHSDFSQVRAGDVLRVNNNTHSVVVLEVKGDSVVVTEGNFNRSIHWGRTLTRQSLIDGNFVVTTRYPA